MDIKREIDRSTVLGQRLETIVVQRQQYPGNERNVLLLTYWSLIFDLHKGILCLLFNGFHGSAFALIRPIVEAAIRAHLVIMCSDEDLVKIQKDTYRTNFSTVGKEVDSFFGLEGLFERFLAESTKLLHSFTHSGTAQLVRRLDGSDIAQSYSEMEIKALINVGESAVFMATILVTKHFQFEDDWKAAHDIFVEEKSL